MREAATKFVKLSLDGFLIEVVFHTHNAFLQGIELYRNRLDKNYSLTDCISMLTMRERGVQEVLTHDHHFEQEGFVILL